MRVEVAVGARLEMIPQRGHELVDNRRHDRVEVIRGEVVNTQFQRTQALCYQFAASSQGYDEWSHQVAQVRQKVTEPCRYGEG